MSPALVLFAKAPVPGRVKTRLTPPLSVEQAAEFHAACVRDVWEKLGKMSATRYFYTDVAWEARTAAVEPGQIRLQRGSDLGERMLNCFLELQEEGPSGVLIVGSDSPTLPGAYLSEGIAALPYTDAVLGPSEDGGYYAIGCRRPHREMFAGVPWSSPETFERTEKNLKALGQSIHKLPPWYDVDTMDDLRRLGAETSLPAHVKRWIDEHRGLLR